MGSKFCNIQLSLPPETVGFTVRGLAARRHVPGWVTLTGESLQWGETQKVARELSEKLHVPALSTEYFDDDFVELAVYVEGKRAARFVPQEYEGFRRVPGNPCAWRQAMGLPEAAEKTLKTVFRERDPETVLRLLEAVLACPLRACGEAPEDVPPPEDASFLNAYLRGLERRRGKKQNRTKLTLRSEVPYHRMDFISLPLLLNRDGEGRTPLWDVADGELRELFRAELPARIHTCLRDRITGRVYVRELGLPGSKADCRALVFSGDGRLLDDFPVPWDGWFEGVFPDPGRFFSDGACRNCVTRKTEWSLERRSSPERFSHILLLPGGKLFFFRQWAAPDSRALNRCSLNVINADGTGHIERELPHEAFLRAAVAVGDALYLGFQSPDCLACFDGELRERWSVPLKSWVHEIFPDPEAGTLTLYTVDAVETFDTETHTVTAVRAASPGEAIPPLGVLPGVGPVIWTGGVEVWDHFLIPVSRHRPKGTPFTLLQDGCRTLLVTSSYPESDTKPGLWRLYELKKV